MCWMRLVRKLGGIHYLVICIVDWNSNMLYKEGAVLLEIVKIYFRLEFPEAIKKVYKQTLLYTSCSIPNHMSGVKEKG